MKKNFISKLRLIFACVLFIQISGCTNDTAPPAGDRIHSADSSEYIYIYDIFNDYPALESLFTYGNLSKDEFEDKLFNIFNDKTQADMLVAMADGFPGFFDQRKVSEGLFNSDVELEMNHKGPIPDLLTSMSTITNSILLLSDEQVTPIYDFLDDLGESPENDESDDFLDIMIEIGSRVVGYVSTLDANDITTAMDLYMNSLNDMGEVGDGKSDYSDVNDALKDFLSEAPGGYVKILQGMKPLLYDEDFRGAMAEVLYKLGEFMAKPELPQLAEGLLRNLNKSYGKEGLGKIFSRIWSKGPIIGPGIKEMDIEFYGKDGKQEDLALQEMLKHPKILDDMMTAIHRVYTMPTEESHGWFDGVGDMFRTYVANDPFCQPRNGDGDFEDGSFYKPNGPDDPFTYENFSALRGLMSLFHRCNVPFTLTSPFLYESEGYDKTKNFFRNLIPEIDTFPIMSCMWFEIYEKDENDLSLGNGRPVTEDIGYGILIDGKYVAPVCPANRTVMGFFAFMVGDALYKGPYDNIYDNYNWLLYKRKVTVTLDLVQLKEYLRPPLKGILSAALLGYKSLPVTVVEVGGIAPMFTMEIGSVIQNMNKALYHNPDLSGFSDNTIEAIIRAMERFLPMGTPVEGAGRLYIMPDDIRALAPIILSYGFYDPEAFHGDKWRDFAHPENHAGYYDTMGYTYKKNKDKINPLLPLAAAFMVGMNKSYEDVVKDFPLTMEGAVARQQALIKEFGVIYPMDLMSNYLSALAEVSTESNCFGLPASETVKIWKYLEPIAAMESTGLMDSIYKLMAVLGKPELADARMNLFEGMAELIETTDKDSTGADTAAGNLLETAIKAKTDAREWDIGRLSMKTMAALLSKDSEYEIVGSIMDLLQYITSVEMDDVEWASASEGIVQILGEVTNEQLVTRMYVNIAEIFKSLNSANAWKDIVDFYNDALNSPEEGLLKYLLYGMESDPIYTWEHLLQETDWFLRSDLMMEYEEGSFWRDLYYMIDYFSGLM